MTHYVGSRGLFFNFPRDRVVQRNWYTSSTIDPPQGRFSRIWKEFSRESYLARNLKQTNFVQHNLSIIVLMSGISSFYILFYITSSSGYADFQDPAYPLDWNGGLLGIHASTVFGSVFRHCLLIVRGVRLTILHDCQSTRIPIEYVALNYLGIIGQSF